MVIEPACVDSWVLLAVSLLLVSFPACRRRLTDKIRGPRPRPGASPQTSDLMKRAARAVIKPEEAVSVPGSHSGVTAYARNNLKLNSQRRQTIKNDTIEIRGVV